MATASTNLQNTFAAIAQAYLDALGDGNFDRVPWAPDAVLRSPILDGPITGRAAVEGVLRPLVGGLNPLRMIDVYVNSAQDTLVMEAQVGPLHVMDRFVMRSGQIVEQENIYDPRPFLNAPSPGGLSADERALLVEMLERGRDRLRATIDNAGDEAWRRKPAAGGWSAAECAEHLALSEEALLGLVRMKILQSAPDPGLPAQVRGKDGVIVRAMQDRSSKMKTFDFLEPQGKWTDRQSARDAFLARRADTLEYARSTRDAVHLHAEPLGPLGALDAYQWLLLIAAHTERHLDQMTEAMAS